MVQKRVCTSSKAMLEYEERHLSNGDYHLEEGKVQGHFVGALADEWNLFSASASSLVPPPSERLQPWHPCASLCTAFRAQKDIPTTSSKNWIRPLKNKQGLPTHEQSASQKSFIVSCGRRGGYRNVGRFIKKENSYQVAHAGRALWFTAAVIFGGKT